MNRAFVASESSIMVDPDKEHQERQLLNEYRSKLVVRDKVVPDLLTITDLTKVH